MDKKEKENLIRKTYYDPEHGFVGREALYRKLKKQDISRKDIEEFLKKQEIVQRTRHQFRRFNSFVPTAPKQEIQMDLIYLDDATLNEHKYVLTAIDVFTKKASAIPLKKKTGEETAQALKIVLRQLGVPKTIYSDAGSEFRNKHVEKILDEHKIHLEIASNHAPFVERFNQTLKHRLFKYLNAHNVKTWVHVLPKIVGAYNDTIHNTTEVKPNEINDALKDYVLWHIARKGVYGRKYKKLKVGDMVRLQLSYDFKKGYKPKWSKELHKVTRINGNHVFVDGKDVYHLRSDVLPIGEEEIQQPIEGPKLAGTKEGHLKQVAKWKAEAQPKPAPPEKKKLRDRTNRLPANFLF